jgi:hypothetical protein
MTDTSCQSHELFHEWAKKSPRFDRYERLMNDLMDKYKSAIDYSNDNDRSRVAAKMEEVLRLRKLDFGF